MFIYIKNGFNIVGNQGSLLFILIKVIYSLNGVKTLINFFIIVFFKKKKYKLRF
jgi:hypothetical protein